MNKTDILEVAERLKRIRNYFEKSGYEAMILGRQDNFAWFTCGGNNRVVITSEEGFTILIITKDRVFAIAQVMDGSRVFDEELKGLDIEPVFLRWYEESREEKALKLIKGLKTISDIRLEGTYYDLKEIHKLHYPLTEKEIKKCRWIGEKTEEIITKIAHEIKPGMSEHDVEAMLLYEYGKYDMTAVVLLVGSDERIFKYRHPNPSEKKIERLVLIHPAIRKWGLHAPITRMVYFGRKVPAETLEKHEAASRIAVSAISMCKKGNKFIDILEVEKGMYKKTGYPDEWKNHFQGGITGYRLTDPTLCMDPKAEIGEYQAFNWFITITGVKVEEFNISTQKDPEVLSVTGKWPRKKYEYEGMQYNMPEILRR